MNSFAMKLQAALDKSGFSQAELSRRTGIGRNSISDYLKGKYEAKQENIYLLAKALNVNEGWLMGFSDVSAQRGSNILSIYNKLTLPRQEVVYNTASDQLAEQQKEAGAKEDTHGKVVDFKAEKDKRKLPDSTDDMVPMEDQDIIGELSAGHGATNWDKCNPIATVSVPVASVPNDFDLAFVVKGDSMEPTYHNGEVVYVKETTDVYDGMIAAVEIDGEAFIKKIYIEGEAMRLVSLNDDTDKYGDPLYPDFYADADEEVYLIGKVVK